MPPVRILQPLLLIGLAMAPAAGLAGPADRCQQLNTTLDINLCLSQAYEASDRRLNQAYQTLLRRLTPGSAADSTDYSLVRRQLVDAQLAWIRYRDLDCRAKYTLFAAGSIRHAVLLGCLLERSEERTAQLRNWIEPQGH